MAKEAPDPRTFQSWEDAFQYPIPAVRRMNLQLKSDVASNSERLRSLVGASYRDLLGTAETIVLMDNEITAVEKNLQTLGARCNSWLLEKSVLATLQLRLQDKTSVTSHLTFISQLSLLRSCPDIVARLLRESGSLLLASKVLIISRLLLKGLSREVRASALIDKTRTRLAKLRRRLLVTISQRIASNVNNPDQIIDALCSYGSIHNMSFADLGDYCYRQLLAVLGHQVQIYSQASKTPSGISLLDALHRYLQAIETLRTIIPKELKIALSKLRENSIYRSEDVQNLEELHQDGRSKWLPEEIKTFQPYVRIDDISAPEWSRKMTEWNSAGFDQLLSIAKGELHDYDDLEALLLYRKDVLNTFVLHAYMLKGLDLEKAFVKLRRLFISRVIEVIDKKCEDLLNFMDLIEQESTQILKEGESLIWTGNVKTGNLLQNMRDLSLTARGEVKSITKINTHYKRWVAEVNRISNLIQQARHDKWDSLEELEHSVLGNIDGAKTSLTTEDAEVMANSIHAAVDAAYSRLEDYFEERRIGNLGDSTAAVAEDEHAAYMIRVLRLIRAAVPIGYQIDLGTEAAKRCQHKIATAVVDRVITNGDVAADIKSAITVSSLASRVLWSGDPELPNLPSPWAYRLIVDLHRAMTRIGADLWAPSTTKILKKTATTAIFDILKGIVEYDKSSKDVRIQYLFDVTYLGLVLETLELDQEALTEKSAVADNDMEKLQRNVLDYHKKTALQILLLKGGEKEDVVH